MTISRVISQRELARRLGITPRTLAGWIRSGRVVPWFVDDNGRNVFNDATIEADQRRAGEVAAERRATDL